MKVTNIIQLLEQLASSSLQESYDNCGLLTGNEQWECSGILCTLDVTEEVVAEAVAKGCNLIVAHHPVIFGGLKKITGRNYVERTVIAAIKNDIAIYAIHTSLDKVIAGVNGKIADKIGLVNRLVLQPKDDLLRKFYTFIPADHAEKVKQAMFNAGAGNIGNYSECSFSVAGEGTFKASDNATPFVGEKGSRHTEAEIKVEVIFPAYLQHNVIKALKESHPYEEVAYDIVALENTYSAIGSGLIGELEAPIEETDFLKSLKDKFNLTLIRHTALLGKPIKRVALCGGAGSFLTKKAISAKADIFISADYKYHEFFDAENKLIIADIGHWESEQYTIDILTEVLQSNFPTFAVLKTTVSTNPVFYFC
ncbi:MAG: Nif3-like dinuclear metal center hexameric protein [Bacteroidota bacterium]